MDEEVAVLLMSDLHYGEHTASYNPEVLEQRLRRCFAKTRELVELEQSPQRRISKLVIAMLGDMPDGAGIYRNQTHNQCVTDPLQQCRELAEMLTPMIKAEHRYWEGNLEIQAVPGNHGRISKDHADSANFDMLFYDYLRMQLGGICTIKSSGGGSLTARNVDILGHNILLHHGHDIPMVSRTPWYGLENSALSWQITSLGPFNMLCCGHFHRCGLDAMSNEFDIFLTGSPVTDDPFPEARCKANAINQFWLLGMSEKRLNTWAYRINLLD